MSSFLLLKFWRSVFSPLSLSGFFLYSLQSSFLFISVSNALFWLYFMWLGGSYWSNNFFLHFNMHACPIHHTQEREGTGWYSKDRRGVFIEARGLFFCNLVSFVWSRDNIIKDSQLLVCHFAKYIRTPFPLRKSCRNTKIPNSFSITIDEALCMFMQLIDFTVLVNL